MIHINHMVDDPASYRWTSYRRHAFGEADARLTPLTRSTKASV
jgi:hypothetical protein